MSKKKDIDETKEALTGDGLMEIAKAIAADESKPSAVNQPAVERVKYVHGILKEIISGEGTSVDLKLHDPFPSIGCVSLVGKEIIVTDIEGFKRAVQLSAVTEAFPKVDGTVQVDFTFHGLTE